MKQIPKVDLRNFLSDDPVKKNAFVKEIGEAFSNIGFVALKGHFLDDAAVEELYDQVKQYFALPQASKDQYEIENLGGQRGYTSFGKESAKGRSVGDLKEFWHFGQEVIDDPKLKKEYPNNISVKELPEFKAIGLKTYRLLENTAREVLAALALYLDLDKTYFDPYITNGNSILRAIHYPPIATEPKEAVRAAAHGDINLITLLMGAQGSGLQVQNHNGDWIDAIAAPDELMINIGDMLSRLTNNRLKSTVHRVTNPPRELWKSSRYSVPFFMHPVGEMPLNCLSNCVDDKNPKQFEDITAGAFLHERLIELGLVKK